MQTLRVLQLEASSSWKTFKTFLVLCVLRVPKQSLEFEIDWKKRLKGSKVLEGQNTKDPRKVSIQRSDREVLVRRITLGMVDLRLQSSFAIRLDCWL